MLVLPSGGTGCGAGGPDSTWRGGEQSSQAAVLRDATPLQRDPRCHTWDTMASASPGQHCGHPGQPGRPEVGGSFCRRGQQRVGGLCILTLPWAQPRHGDAHGARGHPRSPAAGGRRRVLCRAAGASQSGQGGHGGCGRSGAGAGCHRSCGWLCGMCQLGCHRWGLGMAGAVWGAGREQGRHLASSGEPPSPARSQGVPGEAG